MKARSVVAVLLLLSLPASAAVPASVPFLGRRASDPSTPCVNGTHYYNTASNTERCCRSVGWHPCGDAVVTGAADTGVMFVHPASTVTTDATHFFYGDGTGVLQVTGPTNPGFFTSAGSGGTAVNTQIYVDPATGIARVVASGVGLGDFYIGADACTTAVHLRTCGLDSARIESNRIFNIVQPLRVSISDSNSSCVLDGGTPATCQITVAITTCQPFVQPRTPLLAVPGAVNDGAGHVVVTAGVADNGSGATVNVLCL